MIIVAGCPEGRSYQEEKKELCSWSSIVMPPISPCSLVSERKVFVIIKMLYLYL
jgi:hypothetical protein